MFYELIANYTNIDPFWKVGVLVEGKSKNPNKAVEQIEIFSPVCPRSILVNSSDICEMGETMNEAIARQAAERLNHYKVIEKSKLVLVYTFAGVYTNAKTIDSHKDINWEAGILTDYNYFLVKFTVKCAKDANVPVAFYDESSQKVSVFIGDKKVSSFIFNGMEKALIGDILEAVKKEEAKDVHDC